MKQLFLSTNLKYICLPVSGWSYFRQGILILILVDEIIITVDKYLHNGIIYFQTPGQVVYFAKS